MSLESRNAQEVSDYYGSIDNRDLVLRKDGTAIATVPCASVLAQWMRQMTHYEVNEILYQKNNGNVGMYIEGPIGSKYSALAIATLYGPGESDRQHSVSQWFLLRFQVSPVFKVNIVRTISPPGGCYFEWTHIVDIGKRRILITPQYAEVLTPSGNPVRGTRRYAKKYQYFDTPLDDRRIAIRDCHDYSSETPKGVLDLRTMKITNVDGRMQGAASPTPTVLPGTVTAAPDRGGPTGLAPDLLHF